MYGQNSLRTSLISTWKDSTDLTIGYNDVWGYVAPSGEEYAIIGTRTKVNFVNVTDPANPFGVLSYTGGSNIVWRDMKTFRHYAYSVCDACSEGLQIFDLSGLPNSVTHVNQITQHFTRAHNIFIEGSRLYVVGLSGIDLMIFDLSADPVNPTLLASIDLDLILGTGTNLLYIHDIFVQRNIAYASHGNRGMYIWDVSDPQNVTLIAENEFDGTYNHSSWASENGDYLYVAEEVPTGLPMRIADIRDKDNGEIRDAGSFIDNLATGNSGNVTHHNPFVKDDLLYISSYEDGLKVYDIRTPESPELYAYYDTHQDDNVAGVYSGYRGAWGVYPFLPSGNILVSDRVNGLIILDVDNFDCDGTARILGTISHDENVKYSCCIISGITSSISGNVDSKYTAKDYIQLSENFEVKQGSRVLFDIEACGN